MTLSQGMTLPPVATLDAPQRIIETAATALLQRADEASLTALNAAIEAAQTGAAGHGFALIAEAVRALAEGAERRARAILEDVAALQGAGGAARAEAFPRLIVNADAVALAAAQASALAVAGSVEAARAGLTADSAEAAAAFGDFAREAAVEAERVKLAAYSVVARQTAAPQAADAPTPS